MRVVIAGGGNVGQHVARDLHSNGHDVLLMEKDPDVVQRARDEGDMEWLVADACEASSLSAAHLEVADVVAAVTGDDEDNLVISLLAKQEFAVPRVIARINHPENSWLFNETWGVDVAVSTPQLVTALIEEAVTVGSLVRLLQLEGGQVRLVEVKLADNSPAADRMVRELEIPRDVTFVAIIRDDHVVVPRGDTVLTAGDEVLLLVTPESEPDARIIMTGV